MTPEQLRRFYELGCVSRSLMKLCETEGQPITINDYCAQFEHLFINQTDKYGELEDSAFDTVRLQLPLPQKKIFNPDYWRVKSYFDLVGRNVLALSEIDLNSGRTNKMSHCSVLLRMEQDEFEIWTPLQNGTDHQWTFTQADWHTKQFTALILC